MRHQVLVVAAVLLALTACGDSRPADPDAKTADIRTAALKYAACMRERGYQFPDPTFDEQGLPRFTGPGEIAKGQNYTKDMRECRPELDRAYAAAGVEGKSTPSPEQLVAFTRCVREQGVTIADPDPEHGLVLDKETLRSPAWPAAARACKEHLPPEYAGIGQGKQP
jgi:hypothetical protein